MEGGDVGLRQRRDRFRRWRAAIGGIAEQRAVHGEAADGRRLAELDHQPVERFLTRAVELFLRERRILHDVRHDGEHLGSLVGAAADGDVGGVGPGLAPMKAPSVSIWRAISVAERVSVPRVARSAVMVARPALSCGSSAPPAEMRRLALTSGRPGLLATMTRRPLASVFSTGARDFAATAGPAAGGCARAASAASE